MKLPPSLAPWRAQLERFPEEFALALAPLVQRLAAAVGPLASAYVGSTQPNGYDGVTQRGDYQRLLASEWLLAEEEPDEFLRRAAMREHLFLRLAEREPSGCKRSIALFDAGPSQLGTPRLAHIAMLAVLERRARTAGAEFEFGVLQRPEPAKRRVDTTTVQQLLGARSAFEGNAADVAAWLELLAPLADEDEIWWVGGAGLVALASSRPGPRMWVRDPLRAENDRLEVELHVRERRQQLSLELPEPSLRTLLIRDPFQPVALAVVPKSSGDFRFSADGRRLLVHQAPVWHAYVTSRGASGAPRVFRPPEQTLLAGLAWHRRHFAALLRNRAGWFVVVAGERYPATFVGRTPVLTPRVGQLFLQGKRGQRVLFLDDSDALFRGERQADRGYRFRIMVDRVLLLVQRPGNFGYFARAPGGGVHVGALGADLAPARESTVESAPVPLVFSTCDPETQLCAFAVKVSAPEPQAGRGLACWAIHFGSSQPELVEIHSDHQVLGLIPGPEGRSQAHPHDFRLLVRPASARGLLGVGVRGTDALLSIDDASGEVALSSRGGRLAYRTTSGHICVRNVWTPEQRQLIASTARSADAT